MGFVISLINLNAKVNMADITTRKAFLQIKPFCDLLMKAPKPDNANDVEIQIKSLPNSVVQDLTEYILYPVMFHIQNVGYDTKIRLIGIITTTVSKVKIENNEFFNKIYFSVLHTIFDPSQPNLLILDHEELKGSVVQCLNCLMQHAKTNVIEQFYTRENASKISQIIYLYLSIAKTEKLLTLKISSIEALIILTQTHDASDTSDTVLRNQVADIIMIFLPGIVKALQEVYLGNNIVNHKSVMVAVKALGRILSLVMEDVLLEERTPDFLNLVNVNFNQYKFNESDPLGIQLKQESKDGIMKIIQITERNEEWFNAAAEKLQPPISNLMNLTQHQHFKVRKELLEAVKSLVTKCTRNLKYSFPDLIDIIITLSEDEYQEIRSSAIAMINEINSTIMKLAMKPLSELLEERLLKHLIQLPRHIRRSDNATQLTYLNKITGYLKILGKSRIPYLMTSGLHLQKLILSLVYVIELDSTQVPILYENQLRTLEDFDADMSLPSWKRFKYVRDSTTEKKLILICQQLGTNGDIFILIDTVFELMKSMSHYKKELILLLNWTLKFTNNADVEVYRDVINGYVSEEMWYSPIDSINAADGDDDKEISLRYLQNNVVKCCLLTEGLGIFASVLEIKYQQFLLKTLYLVIERAGSGNALISHVGHIALLSIAKSQCNESITDLIRDNFDYISYHVTIKLKRVKNNPGVLNVVNIVMKYSSKDMLPCLKEIVQDTIEQLGQNFSEYNSYALLKVLYIFAVCLRQLLGINNENYVKNNSITDNKYSIAEKVIKNLLEYYEAKRVFENFEYDNKTDENCSQDIINELNEKNPCISECDFNDKDEKEISPPDYIIMIVSVMKTCLNFLPGKEITKTLLAMQTLQEGFYILANYNEQLLPIVHQVWHPLVHRFQDNNILIISRAWQLLYTLALVSNDFIKSRTLKEVSPALLKFLNKSSKESFKKDSRHAYKFTQMFKLQKLLLMQMGQVAIFLNLLEPDLWNLLTLAAPYLSCYQHPELQENSVNLYKKISKVNGDIVFVKCLSLWNLYVAPIPSCKKFDINNLNIHEQSENNSEYIKNIRKILTYIQKLID